VNTHLKTKSEQNINLADQITTNGSEFASSVHCSYYSCVQLMLHILRSHFEQSDTEVENRNGQENGNTHIFLINTIGEELQLTNNQDFREFRTKINQLKGVRIKSDYKNVPIEQELAVKALAYANTVRGTLMRNFRI
jgi:hypothetical protein